MANVIVICWMPWDGKTTVSHKIRDYFDKEKISYALIHTDETHVEFMKRYYKYMAWEDMRDNLQYHYQQVSEKIKNEYYEYLMNKINENIYLENIIIEWRHITEFLYKLNTDLYREHKITNVYMDKEQVMIMNGVNCERNMELYKDILQLN